MSLADQIKEFQQGAIKKIPKEILEKMLKATEELEKSGEATGLATGEKAPDFTLRSAAGDEVTLYEELEKGPVILMFYRGTWCPYCNLEVKAYQNILPEITEAGGQLIAVSPQTPDQSLSMKEKHDLAFHVLSDPNGKVAVDYNLLFKLPDYLIEIYDQINLDIPAHNGEDSWTLPVPATFIINQDKTIDFASVDADYTKRAEPVGVVAELKKLKA
ncbi:peroxiredoxin-like family protein [Bacillus sp. 2205SS5-2]|uniref:peroxiredoxin-like family protein n=1 Tax=Bacillus sp. 2205SS5-2 TaxID=3109031 RepID=UPI00300580EF